MTDGAAAAERRAGERAGTDLVERALELDPRATAAVHESGRGTSASTEGKARHPLERISPELPRARALAEPLLGRTLERLDSVRR